MMKTIIDFFSTKSVKENIIKGTLSNSRLFIYFYLIIMFDAVWFTQQSLAVIGKQATLSNMVNIWGYLIITSIGMLILFFTNGGTKDNNFLTKFFAFSFTVGLSMGLLLLH